MTHPKQELDIVHSFVFNFKNKYYEKLNESLLDNNDLYELLSEKLDNVYNHKNMLKDKKEYWNYFYMYRQALLNCAETGYLELAKFMLYLNKQFDFFEADVFVEACKNGQLHVAKLFVDDGMKILQLDKYGNEYNVLENALVETCKYTGHFEIIKYLIDLGVNIHFNRDCAFRLLCENGYIEVAKWLYDLKNKSKNITTDFSTYKTESQRVINKIKTDNYECMEAINVFNESVFDTDGNQVINISADYSYAFRFACLQGHFEMAKWLHQIGVNIHALEDLSFVYACESGNEELVDWLLTKNVDIYAHDSSAIKKSYKKGYTNIVKKLKSLGMTIL